MPGSNDELHIVVIDEDGDISIVLGQILESLHIKSFRYLKTTFGVHPNYYVTVIENESNWVYWLDHSATMSSAIQRLRCFFWNRYFT